MIIATLLVALLSASAAAAATPASWARAANHLCGLQLKLVRAIPRPPAGDPIKAAEYIDKVDSVAYPLTRQIARLPRPASEMKVIRSWLAVGGTIFTHNQELANALRAGDSTRASQLGQTLAAAGSRADTIARRLGAKVCAESP